MGVLFDALIPALIILGVAFVWLRTLLSRFLPPRGGAGQAVAGSPRSFMESGGMVQPARRPAPTSASDSLETRVDLAHVEDRPARPARERSEPAPVAKPPSTRRIRRALGSREAVRTAFLVKEVLDPPVSMRG